MFRLEVAEFPDLGFELLVLFGDGAEPLLAHLEVVGLFFEEGAALVHLGDLDLLLFDLGAVFLKIGTERFQLLAGVVEALGLGGDLGEVFAGCRQP